MTHKHEKKVCSCGVVIIQCKCPAKNKRTVVVDDGCPSCQSGIKRTPFEKAKLNALKELQHDIQQLNKPPSGVAEASAIVIDFALSNQKEGEEMTDGQTEAAREEIKEDKLFLDKLSKLHENTKRLLDDIEERLDDKSEDPVLRSLRIEVLVYSFRIANDMK